MQTLEMIETAPRHWEAQFVVERRNRWFALMQLGGLGAVYLLIFGVLWATGFR